MWSVKQKIQRLVKTNYGGSQNNTFIFHFLLLPSDNCLVACRSIFESKFEFVCGFARCLKIPSLNLCAELLEIPITFLVSVCQPCSPEGNFTHLLVFLTVRILNNIAAYNVGQCLVCESDDHIILPQILVNNFINTYSGDYLK